MGHPRYTQTRAVWVLVGWTDAWWAFVLALIMLLYNVCRGALTLRVSGLREAEERSLVTPRMDEYWPLHCIHRLAKWLLVVAVSATLFNVGFWVWTTRVYTPTGIVAGPAASQPTEEAEQGSGGAEGRVGKTKDEGGRMKEASRGEQRSEQATEGFRVQGFDLTAKRRD